MLIRYMAYNGFIKINRLPRHKFINISYTDKGRRLYNELKELQKCLY